MWSDARNAGFPVRWGFGAIMGIWETLLDHLRRGHFSAGFCAGLGLCSWAGEGWNGDDSVGIKNIFSFFVTSSCIP